MDRQEYLNSLSEQIRCKRAVPYVIKELEDHIEDQKADFIEQGMLEEEAEEAAVQEMGDPVEVGVLLDRVHRPKMEWSVVIGVLIMSAIGLGIQILLANCYYMANGGIVGGSYWGGYWNGYWEIMNVLNIVSRHLLGVFIGIVLMMVICYLDYSILIKWAFPVWVLLHISIVVCCILRGGGMSVWVNGRSLRAIQIAYLLTPFYAGIVYHYRGQAEKGLIKSSFLLIISVVVIMQIPDASAAFVNFLTGIVILCFAVFNKWFGERRKRLFTGLAGGIIIVGILALLLGFTVFQFLPPSSYYTMRFELWRTGESFGYLINTVKETAQNVKVGNGMEQYMVDDIKNSYVWTYLFAYLGTWKGMVLLSTFVIFMIGLLCLVLQQKNKLGNIVGTGCVVYICIQAIVYIGNNFNMIPLGSCYMPFISNGIAPLLATYFYMGILLAVFRNRQVVKN